jgi:hypothetical protein
MQNKLVCISYHNAILFSVWRYGQSKNTLAYLSRYHNKDLKYCNISANSEAHETFLNFHRCTDKIG